ncbi:MAG: NYN domain-containing protein [Anaerovoracaceae bacterium]
MGGQKPEKEKKYICAGLLAHVDAGKTTLSEALLYSSGMIRNLGRVDHRDAFLDTDPQERERGITIFSKQAELDLPGGKLMLLDTPGHADFSAEMERTLQVLDYAILVISGKDGVQGHTVTLWNLLKKHEIPVFVFINKMDLEGTDPRVLMEELVKSFGGGCVRFSDQGSPDEDALSMCSEALMEEILERGAPSEETLRQAIAARQVFPCFFGSALKLSGVDVFLNAFWGLCVPAAPRDPEGAFGARVYKITRDPKGTRLTHLKVTSGTLKVKSMIGEEKAEQIRIYSGQRFYTCDRAETGTICAVAGLTSTFAGQGLGCETGTGQTAIEPVMIYRLILEDGEDPYKVYTRLKQLQEEDPLLRIVWNEHLQIIQLQLMGEVQLEILQNIIAERFGIRASFGQGRITYRETLSGPVIGSGHFEPLRHYAEVHLLMEPAEPGAGIVISSSCSSDELDTNWQRLIATHIAEKDHAGVLTGFPVTDLKISIIAGRAHQKHTEGGDFRQATYRAIRQGLMKARQQGLCVLLEPWYEFRLEVPSDMTGRAMADIQRMGGSFEAPLMAGEYAVLEGKAPASELKDYGTQVSAYTRGFGRFFYSLAGYEPCHNTRQVVEELGYDPETDVENTADSVFCSHGAGITVPWHETEGMFHIHPVLTSYQENSSSGEEDGSSAAGPDAGGGRAAGGASRSYSGTREEDQVLKQIFERTYGEGSARSNRHAQRPQARRVEAAPQTYRPTKPAVKLPEYIFVDGYNVIFAWEELKALAAVNIDSAREALIDILVNYQGYRKCRMTVVFDAYRIKGGIRHEEKRGGVDIVFTKEDETADTYIERTTYGMEKNYMLRVVSSDRLEQMMIMASGALRVSATEFLAEVKAVDAEIQGILSANTGRVEKETRRGVDITKNTEKKS